MTPNTKKIVLFILMLFFVSIFIIIVFFSIKIFFIGDNGYDFSFLKDDKFSKLMEEEDKKNINEYIEIEYLNCFLPNNKEIKHQEKAKFYSRSAVGPFESCEDFAKMRMCNDGQWTGDPKYKYESCKRMVDCKIDDSTILKNGKSIKLYSREEVDYGKDCERYAGKRTCKDSFLVGDKNFKYKKCSVDMSRVCNISGIILGDGQSRSFFSKEFVEYTDSCENYMKRRICSLGKLYGDEKYSFLTCTKKKPKDCFLDGKEVKHENSDIFYSKTNAENGHSCQFFSIERKCINGVLDGLEEYKYSSCKE